MRFLKCRTRGIVIGVGCDHGEGDASIAYIDVKCSCKKSNARDSITISGIVGDAWMHHDGPIKIERAKKQDNVDPRHGIVAHPTRTIMPIHPIFIRSNSQCFLCEISL